ncbi:MAG: pyrimidine 5'-nucleotidase [Zymomonas mobilis subsp. pomaceae]|uniref:Pyrimidine 5'-nucleotidase n=1 Tax=Zymomonas mobilis subsp. pomaceae (strain ATCC 29192 / DSM 22645 / JCM 10191 / CCUG 17912 / NBRC 13757 / NCIMB 11200 / NRRL B-4491 / Barker I) TaxID=579138 RepID=F8ESA5_ZYMMT|nr:pyrimidine 5'-nucleotidase [Zymomonas mobilis]AEI37680.1 pyrimidine 5'-nucleotidase [Zymomonas mobilis subsp. pomaceae ATCC 29192]MDX5949047.1 pyrimidine 5'-nucleotidase [Zymomonas mobilis subsp. pomaceae]GEB88852.1 pyrimidine 5'-nucleotidase [Zymomonas mobilis subsp. pomaceae]
MISDLQHVENWIFDLDNTLYPPSADLFSHIDVRMADYIAKKLHISPMESQKLQQDYYLRYGASLAGLKRHHNVDPHDYLAYAHNIEMSSLKPDPTLRTSIEKLPGRKWIFTNGDQPYAERVLHHRGLSNLFEDVFDIHSSQYRPKPDPFCYQLMLKKFDVTPKQSLFVDDMACNLLPAKDQGMTTVWVNHGPLGQGHITEGHEKIDYEIHDVSNWLKKITT